jgi:hypothetical protein
MMKHSRFDAKLTSVVLGMVLFLTHRCPAEDPSLFPREIAPLLQRRCVQCHNEQKARGGLQMTSRERLLKGGDNGTAVVPGVSSRSLLTKMISGPKPAMPKQGRPLSADEVRAVRRWVDAGAPWPAGLVLTESQPRWRVGADWWSLRRLTPPGIPSVRDASWVRTPVDSYVLATLESKGLRPSPEADRRTLIRRLSFDLHGLPPAPGEIDAFLKDPSSDAYDRLVDRLLASPRYGERWGRHWLDVVHYGDTHGYDKDKRRDHAWPYRDYVIRSFNEDKPYSRFARDQIAGDVFDSGDPDGVIATGFIAAGPWDFVGHVELREGTVDKEKTRLLDRDDMVSNTISTFLSLTAHCARCHDHKFDPIPKRDYYRLQAVFAGVDRGNRPCASRVPVTQQAAGPQKVFAVLSHAPRPIRELNRGDVQQPGLELGAGALSCVPELDVDWDQARLKDEGSRRAALAAWITDRRNVLTWRSIANRVWQYHFGRGLVDTPNDFGWNGSRPTQPELLDWLALELLHNGQSLKKLHRLIVGSATYRQASGNRPECAKTDADNRYLWRMNRQRLDAESLRDAVLAVSGWLDLRMGGPGFELFRFKDDHSPVYDFSAIEKVNDPSCWRRTVYRFTVRSVPNPFLECLDCADPNLNVPVRSTTLTALQALALLNDPFMLKQSELFADRLRQTRADLPGRISTAYLLAFGRLPTAEEREELASFAGKHGLVNACRLLFNANEFVFVD